MQHNYDPSKHKRYNPVHKEKYIGKYNPICRSSWEYSFCRYLDNNRNVIEWSSETLVIKYLFMGKIKKYYPDFIIKLKNNKGEIITHVIEIKPFKETIPPKITTKKTHKTKIYESFTWEKNKSKWKSAEMFCKKMGYKFVILTEKDLF